MIRLFSILIGLGILLFIFSFLALYMPVLAVILAPIVILWLAFKLIGYGFRASTRGKPNART